MPYREGKAGRIFNEMRPFRLPLSELRKYKTRSELDCTEEYTK